MQKASFRKKMPGTLRRCSGLSGEYWAYVPNPLPPKLSFSPDSIKALSRADLALGELKGISRMLPNPHLLIGPFLRREAVSSSRIEGTVTNFEQLVIYEVDPSDKEEAADRQEVANYVRALEYGLKRLKNLPVSLRLMREVHKVLMRDAEDRRPGEFRDRQNMIGREGQSPVEARFVPPPVAEMHEALNQLEKFIGYPSELPVLVELALIHYQFETIHPFLDGNGRLGRLLISLLLSERACLPHPLLYLSDYLERHRQTYVDQLLRVSQGGDWHGWIDFFLRGVEVQSRIAVQRCGELLDLWNAYKANLKATTQSTTILHLLDLLFERPAITISQAADALRVTYPAAQKNVERLEGMGILREVTGRSTKRIYVAKDIVAIIEKPEPHESI